RRFIVATETGIFYKMQQAAPDKEFIAAPTSAAASDFRCNATCPWMKMNSLEKIYNTLKKASGEIILAPEIISKALRPLTRMLEFKKKNS
ncbi:MAG TPA: quinolinate synthase NadA, partial [Candidatus Rifleibacterium sp.]|nr:quinolinate synthase NadA [Candidatus Rifleibacterium sp.]